MAIKAKIVVRENTITGDLVASANIVDLQEMSFDEFCEYLSQDSTVGSADVAAVMRQLEKKLPLILGMGTKVQISAEGMCVKPTVSGSLTQGQLKERLMARKESLVAAKDTAAADKVDVERKLMASDLKVEDLKAGISVQFSKKFNRSFSENVTFKRVQTGMEVEPPVEENTPSGGGEVQAPSTGGSSGGGEEVYE